MNERKTGRWLLISGGHLEKSFAEEIIKSKSPCHILVIDGALEAADMLGLCPEVILGDFDTVDSALLARYRTNPDIVFETHDPVKNETDTELALDYAIAHGAEHITILGALGGRMDHAIANIQGMLPVLKTGVSCEILDEQNRITLLDSRKTVTFKREESFGKYISFIPLTEKAEGITMEGFAYPLQDFTMTLGSSRGISNELAAEEAGVSFDRGVLLCIESRD